MHEHDTPEDDRLARYLSAAFIADQLDTRLQTALKNYCLGQPGDYWTALAQQVRLDMSRNMFAGLPPRFGRPTNDPERSS